MRLRESGILDHLAKSNSKRTDKCKIKYIEAQSQAGNNGIKLYAMASAFIVLGIGVGLSLLVFALEIIVYYSSRRTRTTPIQQNKSTAPVATTLVEKIDDIFHSRSKIIIESKNSIDCAQKWRHNQDKGWTNSEPRYKRKKGKFKRQSSANELLFICNLKSIILFYFVVKTRKALNRKKW